MEYWKDVAKIKKLKKLALLPVAAVLCWLVILLPAPTDSIVGTWQEDKADSSSQHSISVEFQANGKETQQLQTVQGLLVASGNYTLDTVTLKQTFVSASLNGKPTQAPASNSSAGYRCKVVGNGLELDSRALAAKVPGEHFLPMSGQQLLLLRVEGK